MSANPYSAWFSVAHMSPVDPVSTPTTLSFISASDFGPSAKAVSDWSLS